MPSERSAPRAVLFLLAATCSFAGLGAAQSFPGEIVYQGLPIDQGPVSAGNRVFFTTREGQYPFLKYRLHVTDGTLGSTHGIVALCPAGCGVPLRLLALPNGVVLVLEHLPSNGNKTLWRSDGTESGTWPLLVDRYSVTLLGKVRARALVFEYQGSGSNRTYWSTDGETLEVLPLPAPLPTPGLYDPLIEDGDVGYLVPQSGGLEGVIISNGTPSGTRISAALPSSSSIEVPLAGALLSASWQPGLPILSRVDAVDASVSFFRIPTSLTSAWIRDLLRTTFGAVVLVDGLEGRELWRTDGTFGGTSLLAGATPTRAFDGYTRTLLAEFDRAIYYVSGGQNELRLSSFDLRTAEVRDHDVLCTGESECLHFGATSRLISVDGGLLFSIPDGPDRLRWRRLRPGEASSALPPSSAGESPRLAESLGLEALAGTLVFPAEGAEPGFDLWWTDGNWTERLSELRFGAEEWPPYVDSVPIALANGKFLYGAGAEAGVLWAANLTAAGALCRPSPRSSCLQGNRFRVRSEWKDFAQGGGLGTSVELTSDTGSFWFFDPANVELVLKVLDGGGVNEAHWVFYGALSNVQYRIEVLDMATGTERIYLNPSGNYASVGDTTAFPRPQREGDQSSVPGEDLRDVRVDSASLSTDASCNTSATRLCLQQARFAVEASWRDFQGNTGVGTAVALSADTGYFWFFNDANVEVILKVLDGRPVNDRFWVYYGALSNVEYTLTVTDTLTGAVKQYFNPAGRFASVGDNDAF